MLDQPPSCVLLLYNTVFLLDPNNGIPLYVQLRRQFQRRILAGRPAQGEQLPSVRELSAQLHINPLTVAKVYQLLEHDGLVETRRGMGTYVLHQPSALRLEARRAQIGPTLEQLVVEALQLGLGEKQIQALVADKFRELKRRTDL